MERLVNDVTILIFSLLESSCCVSDATQEISSYCNSLTDFFFVVGISLCDSTTNSSGKTVKSLGCSTKIEIVELIFGLLGEERLVVKKTKIY